MKCIKCNEELEKDDNYCPQCGHWTANGYSLIKNKKIGKNINNEKSSRLLLLLYLFVTMIIIFIVMISLRGYNLFKPFAYLKKQVFNYKNGYNVSLIKNDNKYVVQDVDSYSKALNLIKEDYNKQKYLCLNDSNVNKLEYELEMNNQIPSVSFCDMSYDMAKKVYDVIKKMYELFPNVKNSLTNITVNNAINTTDYVAYFQPMYQFVNIDYDIENYNKVNKTQILLNSYYFLNDDIKIKDNWYVHDATKESTIAHEFGHYLSFLILLKNYHVDNITYETKNNSEIIKKLIEDYTNGNYSKLIIEEANEKYNRNYGLSVSITEMANEISVYASLPDSHNNIIYDEVIAEAVHDYYLHGNNMQKASNEIIKIIKGKLG